MRKLFLSILALALLVACGSTPEPDTTAPAPPTVEPTVPLEASAPTSPPAVTERTTVRFVISDYEQPMYEDMITAFEEENPDLHIELVSLNEVLGLGPIGEMEIPEDAEQRLVAAADVVNMGVSRETVEQGLVRDLTPFIEADRNFQPDDFYSDALAAYRWSGGTWALPTTINYRLFFYDKEILDEAGVPYPEVGWTMDDLLAKARDLTEREGGDVTRWGFVPNGAAYRLVESLVGLLADYGTEPPLPRYNDADVIQAVQWYADLVLKEQVTPYFEPGAEEDSPLVSSEQALIDGGQAAMWTDVELMWWIRSQQGNIGVAPFPTSASGPALAPASTGSLAMSAGTNQPQAAWRWMDFVSRQPLGTMTMGIKFLPARRSTAEASGYWDDLDAGLAAALRYTVDHGYVAPEPVAYNAFEEALNAILQGEKTVDEAMAQAQQQAEAQIQEEVASRAGATPVPTFAVAPSSETPTAAGATTITFVPGLGSLNLEPFRDLAAQFHQAHPDMVVDVKMADFLSGTPTLPAMAEGADCFEWYPSFQETSNREAILSLAPFVDADPSFPIDDYLPMVLEQFTWQGELLGLPADITPYVIEYNKDLFDAAGLDYPAVDWTWDDFLTLATALTQGEGDARQYGFVAEFYELNDLLLLTERLGARLVDEIADPPALTFDDPATVEAVRWYAALTTEHEVKPVFVTDLNKLLAASASMVEREALITEGRAGMWTSSPTAAAVFGGRGDLNVGAAPPPARTDGANSSGVMGTSGYFISANTENRQACWQWITFLTSQPAAVQGLPARRSVAESNDYRDKVGAEHAAAYLASVGDAEQPSTFQIFSEEEWLGGAIYWYGQAFGQVVEGNATAEEALVAAQKLADDYRACLIAAGDFRQATWEACLKEVDPTLPAFLFQSGG